MKTVAEYISFLQGKGFKLREEALGFISFGQRYTGAADEVVIAAIEATLKHQLHFDGSYFVALLEQMKGHQIEDRKSAQAYARKLLN
ncbi:DUF6123 family protein [Ectobacillus ponti]|uniref:DUF6123 family protein n=1 Tax=Ectobacillus ponti TaxID=2961894 RepID=A0AA42BPW6_9BACI|nr:DUF6123 family protein [Ectobacillus ponti]MCP8968816.1 DUF6123 family protein [Ectobacillus ponti]